MENYLSCEWEQREAEMHARVREDVVDSLLHGAFLIAAFALPISLARAYVSGWLPIYGLHVALAAVCLSAFLGRGRMGVRAKYAVVVVLFAGVGIGGLVQFGLLGVGVWWLVISTLLITILFSQRAGVIAGALTLCAVLLGAWAFVNGHLVLGFDANEYATSWPAWFNLMIGTFVMPFFVFQAVSSLQAQTVGLMEQVRQQRNEIARLATHDQLTGLLRSPAFNHAAQQALSRARRSGKPVAVMFFDLDRFKPVNDTYGHDAGDLLLQTLGERYRGALREEDLIARVGGDEFLVLLECPGDRDEVAAVAQRLIEASTAPVMFGDDALAVGTSVGISLYPEHGEDIGTLRKQADMAMYEVKHRGRNGFRFVDDRRALSAVG